MFKIKTRLTFGKGSKAGILAKKITYRKIKAMQQADINARAIDINVYRYVSTPFTWAFVKLGISPNAITISMYFLCIFGAILLALGTYYAFLSGIFLFILFKIFDDSDGEVARIQNKKSIEGVFFDRISHYVYSICLGFGLGFGLYRLYQNEIYFILGFLFALTFILETAIAEVLLKPIFRDEQFHRRLIENINKGKSWSEINTFSKLFGIYPFQGLIYSDRFVIIILMVLTIIDYWLEFSIGLPRIYNYLIWLMPLYIIIVSISKIIWAIFFVYKMERERYIATTIKETKIKS